jgi:uncharacterized protein (TIGR04255 family)
LTENLPKKLKHDAIVEVAFEVRFDPDPESIEEVVLGRLADTREWRGFTQRRLPLADLSAAFRRADPNLRYQPAVDLVGKDARTIIRIGPQTVAYTRRAPYPGWEEGFGLETTHVIDTLFKAMPRLSVTRLGLRYINALRSDLHGISGVDNLNLSVMLAGSALTERLNLNYTVPVAADSSCTVRIATRDLAEGMIPDNTTIVADLDVFTNEPYQTSNIGKIKEWKDSAHIAEKRRFFQLLKPDTIEALRED